MYIHNNRIVPLKKIEPSGSKKEYNPSPKIETPAYKKELSNLCYCPIFTSRLEMSDEELCLRKKKVKNILKNYYKECNPEIRTQLLNEVLSSLNKDNIKLLQQYLRNKKGYQTNELKFFRYITKENLPVAKKIILKAESSFKDFGASENIEFIKLVTPENAEIAQKLIETADDYGECTYQNDVMKALDKDNIKIASYIIGNDFAELNSRRVVDTFLNKYSKDKLEAFSMLAEKCLASGLPYPSDLLKEFPGLLDEKQAKFMKKFYEYCIANDKRYIAYVNSGNIQLAKELLSYKEKPSFFSLNRLKPSIKTTYCKPLNIVGNILSNVNSDNEDFVRKLLKIYQEKGSLIDDTDFDFILRISRDATSEELANLSKLDGMRLHKLSLMRCCSCKNRILPCLLKQDFGQILQRIERLKNTVSLRPELYINDDEEEPIPPDNVQKTVEDFFERNYMSLVIISSLLDKDAVDNLMRRRFDTVEEYFNILESNKDIKDGQYELIARFNNSCNIHGKPFLSDQKVEFIDLLKSYNDLEMSTDKIEQMLDNGKVDLAELHSDLLSKLFTTYNLLDEDTIKTLPKDKLFSWNIKYVHLLNAHFSDSEERASFEYIFQLANKGNFKELIKNPDIKDNVNLKIKKKFKNNSFNYDNWLTPPENLNVNIVSKDKNLKELNEISNQIENTIEKLRKTPAGTYVDKQFGKYIVDGRLKIPANIRDSKVLLKTYIQNVLKQLNSVWKRAESNIDNPQRAKNAKFTLDIKNSIIEQLKALDEISDLNGRKDYDLTIKMWDRIPQKDLFQGNYTDCCIGMGASNAIAMTTYLYNTTFNMIEVVDNKNGEVIGNALCYLMLDKKKNPVFIIDNIEIKNSVSKDNELRKKIRDGITQYAKNVTADITKSKNFSIYLGAEYNDVPTDDLAAETKNFSLVGNLDDQEEVEDEEYSVYMDLYNGWCNSADFKETCKAYRLG